MFIEFNKQSTFHQRITTKSSSTYSLFSILHDLKVIMLSRNIIKTPYNDHENKCDWNNAPISRWPTRVFATDCLRKIIVACEEDPIHFDLEKAREARAKKKGV